MIRVMHLIVGLDTGGAEMNLYRLVKTMDRTRFENSVVSMLTPGPVCRAIEECGVPVFSLHLTRGIPNPLAIINLARLMHKWKPDLLQTWMYHADLLGGVTAKILGGPPVVWNIRNSDATLSPRPMTLTVARYCARLSSWLPTKIVSCSNAGRDFHLKIGYDRSKMNVIFNGYDCDFYRPDPTAADRLKSELGIIANGKLVVHVGRYHPLKDHSGLLAAARLVRDTEHDVYFVLCGDGVTWQNGALVADIDRLGLRDCVFLLGRRSDVNLILAAALVAVSSSYSEGFPNAVAEAMACGTICVATDVGDTRFIVGNSGIVVPPYRPEELAAGVKKALSSVSVPSPRERIVSQFSMQSTVENYETLYTEIMASAGSE